MENGFDRPYMVRLMRFLERVDAQAGQVLIRQGEEANDLYFIEQGAVSVYREQEDGKPLRMRTLGLGTSVGELGLYLGTARTASVIADTPAVVYRLTRQAVEAMKNEDPGLAAYFHE
jgi:SulP family sulfate permease